MRQYCSNKAMGNNCIICNSRCHENNLLTNGNVYHSKCYEDLLEKEKNCNEKIRDFQNRIFLIEQNEKKLFTKIKAYFFGISDLSKTKLNEKNELQQLVGNFHKELSSITVHLKSLYDYWFERPPDWEERRQQFLEHKPFCEKCFSDYYDNIILQIHHKLPISKGGSHKVDNLIVLCKNCHQSKHPYNINSISKNNVNYFKQNLKILNDAVENGRIVSFHYRKREGEKSSRDIKPQGFTLVGKTLCVCGYCYLRHDKRTFAVKRISQLKIE